jgi:hypothetical protein
MNALHVNSLPTSCKTSDLAILSGEKLLPSILRHIFRGFGLFIVSSFMITVLDILFLSTHDGEHSAFALFQAMRLSDCLASLDAMQTNDATILLLYISTWKIQF